MIRFFTAQCLFYRNIVYWLQSFFAIIRIFLKITISHYRYLIYLVMETGFKKKKIFKTIPLFLNYATPVLLKTCKQNNTLQQMIKCRLSVKWMGFNLTTCFKLATCTQPGSFSLTIVTNFYDCNTGNHLETPDWVHIYGSSSCQ